MAVVEVGTKQAQGQAEKSYYAAAFTIDGKIAKYGDVPRREVKRLARELIDDLLEGKIRALYMSEAE